MKRRRRQLWNLETARAIVPSLEIAESLWQRSVGLIGRRTLAVDSGLWIEPCNSIHTMGVRFAIDVVFLDRDGVIVRLVSDLRPWRICGPVPGARTVIELPTGVIAARDLRCGQRLMLTEVHPPVFSE